jgi:phosphatidate cytidylyltransferase
MLRQRILTALVLVPVVILGLYWASWPVISIAVGLLMLIGAWEWGQFVPLATLNGRWSLVLAQAATLSLAFVFFTYIFFIVTVCFWVLVTIAIIYYPRQIKYWANPSVIYCMCLILLSAFFMAIVNLLQMPLGKHLLFYLLLIVWAADSGAYCLGKLCGHHKLIPFVSPGKTVEGIAGGILTSLLVILAGYWYFKPQNSIGWICLGILIVLVSVVGDLAISMLKRHVQIKDSGQILPGHGGILDRLDSLIAASPFFYVGLQYIKLTHG